MTELPIDAFLKAPGPLFDVRSPSEFKQGHIPKAISLPLFNDEERAFVGTVYKQNGREIAIQSGLKIVGPRLHELAKIIRKESQNSQACCMTCFRGGMRSQSIEWLASLFGLSTARLKGGYKAYRNCILKTFENPYAFHIIGGLTGSGKTEKLQEMKKKNLQVIDLEALANHRGSAFGLAPGTFQPSTEHFENMLADALWKCDPTLPIYLEDESHQIGSCTIPKGIYEQMNKEPLHWIDVDFEARLERILSTYGSFPIAWLIEQTQKLQKRLGGERTKTIISALEQNQIKKAACDLLHYYDAAYFHSRARHHRNVVVCKINNLP